MLQSTHRVSSRKPVSHYPTLKSTLFFNSAMSVPPGSLEKIPNNEGPELTAYTPREVLSSELIDGTKPRHSSSEMELASTSKSRADVDIVEQNSDENENDEDDPDVLEMAEQLLLHSRPDNNQEANANGMETDASRTESDANEKKVKANGAKAGTNDIERDTDDIEAGTNGKEMGTNGIEADTNGIEVDTNGIEAGTNGIEAGTNGIEAGTDDIEVDTNGMTEGENGTEADVNNTEAGSFGQSLGEKRKLELKAEPPRQANEKLMRHKEDDDKSSAKPLSQTIKPVDENDSKAIEQRTDEESINGTSDIGMPAVQEESRAKEDDKPRSEYTEKGRPSDINNTKGDSNIRKDTSNNQEEESDEEKSLDLASLNAFEYERVRQYDENAIRRYEQYRRSDLKTAKVRKVLAALNPSLQKVSEHYIIAIKGLAKMFVGDVTEVALEVKRERDDKGALSPVHLREAYRRLRASGVFPTINQPTVAFP